MDSRNLKSYSTKYDSVRFENSILASLVKKYSHRVDLAYVECKEEDSFLPHVPDIKDDEASKKHRHQGKIFFREDKYLEAIKSFTEALKTAKSPLSIAKSLIRRSAVLYRVRLYRECLEDINTALHYGIPMDKKMDVDIRREEAIKLQDDQEKYRLGVFPLNEVNKHIPGASRSVALNRTIEFERDFYAMKDINPGDVIAVQDPLIAICIENGLLHCDHCMMITFSGVPCSGCTKAHYCSSDCLNDAYEQYHREECKIVSMLQPYKVYGIIARMALAIRYNITATEAAPDKFIFNRYLGILDIDITDNHLPPEQINDLERTAARIYHAIENYTDFIIRDHAENEQAFILKGLIMKLLLLRTIHFTTETVTKKLPSGKLIYESKFEMCYALDTFYERTCIPNVITVQSGVMRISRALDYIKQGEKLSISFECFYWDMPKEERAKKLSYRCKCIACIENWPLLPDLPSCRDAEIAVKIQDIESHINTENPKNEQKVLIDKLLKLGASDLPKNTKEYVLYARCLHKCLTSLHYIDDPLDYLIKYASEEKNYI